MGISRLVLDSGGLSAIASDEEVAHRVLRRAVASGASIVVPTVVIAESTHGGASDAELNRFVKSVDVVSTLDETIARAAGHLRHLARVRDVADAVVVATADAVPFSAILTGDPSDLHSLASVRGRTKVVSTRQAS